MSAATTVCEFCAHFKIAIGGFVAIPSFTVMVVRCAAEIMNPTLVKGHNSGRFHGSVMCRAPRFLVLGDILD